MLRYKINFTHVEKNSSGSESRVSFFLGSPSSPKRFKVVLATRRFSTTWALGTVAFGANAVVPTTHKIAERRAMKVADCFIIIIFSTVILQNEEWGIDWTIFFVVVGELWLWSSLIASESICGILMPTPQVNPPTWLTAKHSCPASGRAREGASE